MPLSKGQSAFLWGARRTGKTTLLAQRFPKSIRYDLLESDTFFRLSKEPYLLRQELSALADEKKIHGPIIIDEVQKVPTLLDEVHGLIESKKIGFILCGSSARKLKRSHANMLGGRAWRFVLYPFTTQELGKDFNLMQALNRGLIPSHYLDDQYRLSIKAYINDYLKEEIQYEGLVRNLPAFARFLDTVPFSNGELVNYSNIAQECGVDSKTVAEYYRILVDTLLGQFIEPFRKRRKRQTITATPKFYLFDVGIASGLAKRELGINRGPEFGRAFEHLVFMELMAHSSYSQKDYDVSFWRTKDGLEVDFVIGRGEIAIEVKGAPRLRSEDFKGIAAFKEEFKPKRAIIVSQEPAHRKLDSDIEIIPWGKFFNMLWSDEII
ncbi:MAG: AAA family ATPase [Pseudomonadota bacterium]